MEEFYESEIIWPESYQRCSGPTQGTGTGGPSSSTGSAGRAMSLSGSAAAPVDIPRARRLSRDLGGSEEDEEMVLPHVLLSRRWAAHTPCPGDRRTLKGRDLRHVRNAVLRMTGFLEG